MDIVPVPLLTQHCSFSSRPGSDCTWWRHGRYNWSGDPAAVSAHLRDRLKSSCSDTLARGAFNEHGHWQPSSGSCKWHWLTPPQVHACLRGKRLLVSGDSMMRQLYNRLVKFMQVGGQ